MKKHLVVVFALSIILLLASPIGGPLVASAYTITLTAPTAGDYLRSQNISVVWTAVGPVTSLVDLELRKASDNSLVVSVNSLGMASSPYNFNPASHGVPAGAYYFKAKLWSYNRSFLFATSAPTSNFTILNGPDLVISDPAVLNVNPTTVVAGDTITLGSWTVRNQGDVATPDNFFNGFYLSSDSVITTADTYLGFNEENALMPGQTFFWLGPTPVTISTNTTAGNYYVGILLDRDNTIPESDETNNYKSVPLTVTNTTQPPSITVDSPNGGENWFQGTTRRIGWSWRTVDFDASVQNFAIFVCSGECGDGDEGMISSGLSGTSYYDWTIGHEIIGPHYVQVCGTKNSGERVCDQSDLPFTIAPPSCTGSPCVAMVYPNGGETLIKGQPNTIRWFSNGVPIANPHPLDHFQLELGNWTFSAPMGWNSFTSTLTNSDTDGPGRGNFPAGDGLPPGRYRMTVAYYRNEQRLVSDTSDNWFTIATSSPITVTAPNGGEVWQNQRTHIIQWTPYGYNPDINPASTTVAYLEKKVSGNFVIEGKIIPDGLASIYTRGYLVGEFQELMPHPLYPNIYYYDPPPWLVKHGNYYVRVVNKVTGAWDRSDQPFTLAPENTIWADLKINGVDGDEHIIDMLPRKVIIIPQGSNNTDYLASWTSNSQEKCSLNYYFESRHFSVEFPPQPGEWSSESVVDLPSNSSRNINVFPFTNVQSGAHGYVVIGCPTSINGSGVEGGGFDAIEFYYDSIPTTAAAGVTGASAVKVISPNDGKTVNWSQSTNITWSATTDVEKVSIALYKNSKFFKWIARDLPSQIKNYRWTPSKTISASELGDNFQINLVGQKKVYTGMITDMSDAPFSIINSTSTPSDLTSPQTITDLKLTGTYPNGQAGLNWRAPYEDNNNPASGAVVAYDIRYQIKSPITDNSWSRAIQVADEPAPRAPGTVEIYLLSNLTPRQTYYVAMKSQDAVGNISALSNNVVVKTLILTPSPLFPTPQPTTTTEVILPIIVSPLPVPTPIMPAPITPTPISPSPIPVTPLTLLSTDPPNNAIDARDLSGRLGWKLVSLSFSAHLGSDWNLAADYSISTTNAEPISISNISGSATQPDVVFSRKIVPGERVTIAHQPTNSSVCLGFLPGDVDQNGFITNIDISRLNSWVGTPEGQAQPLWKTDINRDGIFDQADVTRAGELMSAPDRVFRLPACPSASGGLGASPQSNQLANVFTTLRQMLEIWSQLLMSR
ncbi:MAG: CARDB domain-containing protein [Candidatus Vogelbacteria bacterium]